jgi:hypothetical protein
MRRKRIPSTENTGGLPAGQLIRAPAQPKTKNVHATTLQIASGRVVVSVPRSVRDKLHLTAADQFSATIVRGQLVIRRRLPRPVSARR